MKGLVHPINEVNKMDENGSIVEKLIDFAEKAEVIHDHDEKACQCQCSFTTENPNHVNPKEPLSAPF